MKFYLSQQVVRMLRLPHSTDIGMNASGCVKVGKTERETENSEERKRTVILVAIYVSEVGTYVDVSLMASVKGEPEIKAY